MGRWRGRNGTSGLSRRQFLAGVGVGTTGLGAIVGTASHTAVDATRGVSLGTASGESALVGVTVHSPVKKNGRDPLVSIENGAGADATVTVALRDCTQGTLYDPQGESGCSVTFPLGAGGTGTVDIEASVGGADVPFDVSLTAGDVEFAATRETRAETGNSSGAVRINKLQDFAVEPNRDEWTIKQVQADDRDGDDDLDRAEYELTESDGTVVATRTDTGIDGSKYDPKNLAFAPDDASYDVIAGEQYTVTLTVYDADGNFAAETRSATG